MIRVLHFVSTPSIGSGVMSVIMNYYRHIERSKVQFDFLCFLPCEESYEEEIKSLGGQVFFIPKPTLCSLQALILFFKEHAQRYSWLHNHEIYLSFLLQPLAQKYCIPNFIVHCHATKYSDHVLASIRNYLLCRPIRYMVCERFACSAAAGSFLYGNSSQTKSSFYVLPNAIDRQLFQYNEEVRTAYRSKLGLNCDFVIGHIGRFVPQKNHNFLLKVFAMIQKEIPNARLLLIGDGPLKKNIQEKVQRLHLDKKVLFLEKRDDISSLLQAMDIYMLPSIYEGMPVSCLEAQASGLTCFVSDKITPEVKLDTLVYQLPLNVSVWVDKCLKHYVTLDTNQNRVCPQLLPDITCEAKKLTLFYEENYWKI